MYSTTSLNHPLLSPHQPGASVAQTPSSTKPSSRAIDDYTVPPNLPKYIAIPSISVYKTRIMQLGLMKNNEIAAPDNIYDSGWYNGSAKPGEKGAVFIYGHVSDWKSEGIFYNLKKLKPGDQITITRGDGKTYTYSVVLSKIYEYKKVDMKQVLSPIDPKKPGLNLMTCTGHVIEGTNDFSQRLVVFTSLVGS